MGERLVRWHKPRPIWLGWFAGGFDCGVKGTQRCKIVTVFPGDLGC